MKNRFSHFGFTLVELIVGVTISMLLMVSVGVFVSGGMQNIFLQQKVFENAGDFVVFNTTFQNNLDSLDSHTDVTVSSDSILFKSKPYFANGGYSYIGTGASTSGYYCSGSEDSDTTQHLFIKNFIPHFEQADSISDISEILTGSVVGGGEVYTSHVKKHIITDSGGNILVGRDTYGQEVGAIGTGTYLNSPTGLAFYNDILFISDTLNDRILAYDTGDTSIELLLDTTDGIDEPTGLMMSGSSLLIANSGAGEILEYSSIIYSNYPDKAFNFSSIQPNISYFDVGLYLSGNVLDIGMTQDNFANFSTSNNFFHIKPDNIGEYLFRNYGSTQNNGSCTSAGKIYNGGNPIKCINSGSGAHSSLITQGVTAIEIANIAGIPGNGSYHLNIELSNGYQQDFSYFTQGDDNLLTRDDNTLRVLESGLDYPNGFTGINPLMYNTFSGATYVGSFDFNDLYDSILRTPIEQFQVDFTGGLLSIEGKYYKNYDCYNANNRVTREFIWKKTLQ